MARRPSLEERLEQMAALRDLDDEELREELRSALGDRQPMIAGKAARIAADRNLDELVPDIVSALGRWLGEENEDDGEAERPDDPGCLGKTDLARALIDLDLSGSFGTDAFAVLLRGARCVQMEPVWGGQVDAAAELRGLCAMGLAGCRDRRAAEVLADLLADPEAAARAGATRALGASGWVGAELLLRYKARLGDDEPAVLLDAFTGLLEVEPETGLEPIADALASATEDRFEAAAIALGSSRHPEALSLLAGALEKEARWNLGRRKILVRALALQRGDDAAEVLTGLVAEAPEDAAIQMLEVLAEVGTDPRLRNRLAEAVDARGSRKVHRAFRGLAS